MMMKLHVSLIEIFKIFIILLGPSRYQVVEKIGSKYVRSTNKNSPQIKFNKIERDKINAIISNKHVVDLIGKQSPGVGAYNAENSY